MSETVEVRGRVVKVLAATMDLWMLPFATALGGIAKAILDGELTPREVITYVDNGCPESLSQTFAHIAGLTYTQAGPTYGAGGWRADVNADHIAAAVELLRAVPAGDAGVDSGTWSLHEDDLVRYRVSLHQVRGLMRTHNGLVEAAQLVLTAFDDVR